LGADVLIILDARRDMGGERKNRKKKTKEERGSGVGGQSLISYSVKASLSIAERMLRDKNRVGLLSVGSISERVSLAYGRRQFNKIILTLARVKPGGTMQRLADVVHFYFSGISQVILVSPLMDRVALEAAAELSRIGTYDLIVVSPDPLRFPTTTNQRRRTTRRRRRGREARIGLSLSLMERRTNIAQIRMAGALVIDWDVSDPLDRVIGLHNRPLAKKRAVQPFRQR